MPDRMSPLSDREILVQLAGESSRIMSALYGDQGRPGLIEDFAVVKSQVVEFKRIYDQSVIDRDPLMREYYGVVEDVKRLKAETAGKKERTANWAGTVIAVVMAAVAALKDVKIGG